LGNSQYFGRDIGRRCDGTFASDEIDCHYYVRVRGRRLLASGVLLAVGGLSVACGANASAGQPTTSPLPTASVTALPATSIEPVSSAPAAPTVGAALQHLTVAGQGTVVGSAGGFTLLDNPSVSYGDPNEGSAVTVYDTSGTQLAQLDTGTFHR
jgi:hypothetical protein